MRLLIDINIILDVVLARKPWYLDASQLLSMIERSEVDGFVAPHTITTVFYLVAKERGSKRAATAVSDLLRIVRVVPLTDADIQQALVLNLKDFEDGVQAAAAMQIGADIIVTRNQKDFRAVPIEVRNPGEVLALL